MKRIVAWILGVSLALGACAGHRGQDAGPSGSSPGATPADLRSLHMVDTRTGWALGDGAVLKTLDGGRTWADVTPPGIANLSPAPL